MRRAGRLVVGMLDPGLLEPFVIVLHALVHPLRLGRADAQPEQAHLLVERVGVGHDAAVGRLRVERAAEAAARPAEAADVREQVEVLERYLERLHAAHGEPGHRPVLAVRDGAIGRVDHRDEVLDHHILERAEHPAEVGARGRLAGCGRSGWAGKRGRVAGPTRVALLHDDDHGPGLPLGEQVVEDEADPPLVRPAALVLAAAVLQVQHRVARVALGVVAGRGVDEDAPPPVGRLRVVPALADLAVWHVLWEIVIHALLGDLDAAGHLAGAVIRLARGVVDLRAVDEHAVVMEPRHLRFRGRGPQAIFALRRGITLAVKEPEDDLLGVGRLDAERHPQVGVDPRILLAPDVARRGDTFGGFRAVRLLGGRGQEERQQAGEPRTDHDVGLPVKDRRCLDVG